MTYSLVNLKWVEKGIVLIDTINLCLRVVVYMSYIMVVAMR